jgi:hypothetical protein
LAPVECALPARLRAETRHAFDTAAFPFDALIAPLVGAADAPLDRLHSLDEVQAWLQFDRRAYQMRRNPVDSRFKTAGGFRANPALRGCYERLLAQVVLPLFAGVGCGGICFQREPNFRCHLPGTGHVLVERHRDADYHHQPAEVNFWLPCTAAFGSNTVWVESAPHSADFRPFEARFGTLIQFWGHQCEHFTTPNETGRTRLSIDFRVIPREQYCSRYPHSHKKDGSERFALGGFFGVMDRSGAVVV